MRVPHFDWQVKDDDADRIREIGEMAARGMSIRAIAAELEIPKTTVGRDLKRYQNEQVRKNTEVA